jgi:diphthamide synthase (EF-2-diphthine--ammonia ligase)
MRRQAESLGLRHELIAIDRDAWEGSYRQALAALAADGVERVVTGDITPEEWPWLAEACAAAGLALETPLAQQPGDDAAVLLDFLAENDVEATVAGMRAEHYRAGFLGRPIGRALLVEHGLGDPVAFHGTRFVDEDPAAFAHVERDGIWALDWPDTYTSDFH